METQIPPSERLRYERFEKRDADDLAGLLADPHITRNITANGSTSERCLASAHKRIRWHNRYWASKGYGVWALRARFSNLAPRNELIGWCGFIPPENDLGDPEILYGLSGRYRRKGLATEAARHAIAWLFNNTDHRGVTAVISSKLNPLSVKVADKLGMTYSGKMDFSEFLSNASLIHEVLEYEIWRLREGPENELKYLVQQTSFRAGQLVNISGSSGVQVEKALTDALTERCSHTCAKVRHFLPSLQRQFHQGMKEAYMDCYHVTREQWTAAQE